MLFADSSGLRLVSRIGDRFSGTLVDSRPLLEIGGPSSLCRSGLTGVDCSPLHDSLVEAVEESVRKAGAAVHPGREVSI